MHAYSEIVSMLAAAMTFTMILLLCSVRRVDGLTSLFELSRLLRQRNRAVRQEEWVDAQARMYLAKKRQFLQMLMVCMHVTGEYSASLLYALKGGLIKGHYRWPARPRTRIMVRKDPKQHLFGAERVRYQWTSGDSDHVLQGTQTTQEYRVHCAVSARRYRASAGIVVGVRRPIRSSTSSAGSVHQKSLASSS